MWRRLARELRGYPWGLQGCFPKIASDIHYEQLTKAINRTLQLPPAFCPLSLCQENLWGSDTGSQDLLHAVYVFHSMGLCCFVLLLGFKFFIVWWSILTWVIRQFSFPMYFVSFCCSSFGFLVAASLFPESISPGTQELVVFWAIWNTDCYEMELWSLKKLFQNGISEKRLILVVPFLHEICHICRDYTHH